MAKESTNVGQALFGALGAGLQGLRQGLEQKDQVKFLNAQQQYQAQMKAAEAEQSRMLLNARLAEIDANIRKSTIEINRLNDPEGTAALEAKIKAESDAKQFEAFQKRAEWAKSIGLETFRAGDYSATFPTAREQSTAPTSQPPWQIQMFNIANNPNLPQEQRDLANKILTMQEGIAGGRQATAEQKQAQDAAEQGIKSITNDIEYLTLIGQENSGDLSETDAAKLDDKRKKIKEYRDVIDRIAMGGGTPTVTDKPSAEQPSPEEARALLVTRGYVQDANGNWVKK